MAPRNRPVAVTYLKSANHTRWGDNGGSRLGTTLSQDDRQARRSLNGATAAPKGISVSAGQGRDEERFHRRPDLLGAEDPGPALGVRRSRRSEQWEDRCCDQEGGDGEPGGAFPSHLFRLGRNSPPTRFVK